MPRRAVIVCGDREWIDIDTIRRNLSHLKQGDVVIHGDCRGADRLAAIVARERLCIVIPCPYISELGRAGGPARNAMMLRELLAYEQDGCQISVIAFHSDLSRSKGTRNMVNQARKANVRVSVVEGTDS